MKRRTTKSTIFHRVTGWLRAEERYQEKVLEEGVKNVDSIFLALSRGVVHAVKRAAIWPFVATKRCLHRTGQGISRVARKSAKEFMVVVREIGQDVVHLGSSTGHTILRGAQYVLKPLGKATAVVTAPVRKRFASQAKAEALSEVTMTPDHKSHWELFALIGAAAVAGALVLLATGNGSSLGVLSGTASALHPDRLLLRLSTTSPVGLTLLAAFGLLLAMATWFWGRMTLDAWRRTYPTHLERTRWRVITTGLFVPGAVIYFFKVYNHWGIRRFVTYHAASVVVVATAVIVATSTYGTLWYFNKQADAAVPTQTSVLPKLELDSQTRQGLLNRPQYGAPLSADVLAGRTDPFAPVPGVSAQSNPNPGPSPSPSPTPQP